MSGHIIRSFQSVLVIRLILRYEPVINIFHISTHRRIPILTNRQGTTRMLYKRFSSPVFGKGGRCRSISSVTRWNPRLRACNENSICCTIIFLF
jgi:hypothetical protein